jgi:hypothetical protein
MKKKICLSLIEATTAQPQTGLLPAAMPQPWPREQPAAEASTLSLLTESMLTCGKKKGFNLFCHWQPDQQVFPRKVFI